jgi:hypothetical protein
MPDAGLPLLSWMKIALSAQVLSSFTEEILLLTNLSIEKVLLSKFNDS